MIRAHLWQNPHQLLSTFLFQGKAFGEMGFKNS
jgi:hypothetical protein